MVTNPYNRLQKIELFPTANDQTTTLVVSGGNSNPLITLKSNTANVALTADPVVGTLFTLSDQIPGSFAQTTFTTYSMKIEQNQNSNNGTTNAAFFMTLDPNESVFQGSTPNFTLHTANATGFLQEISGLVGVDVLDGLNYCMLSITDHATNNQIVMGENQWTPGVGGIFSISISNSNYTTTLTPNSFTTTNTISNTTITPVGITILGTSGTFVGNTVIDDNSLTIRSNTTPSVTLFGLAGNCQITSSFLSTKSATANVFVSPGFVSILGAGSNAGLTLGTSVKANNGYTFLPNGLLLQWGRFTTANSTSQVVTLPTTFPTNIFAVTATPVAAGPTTMPAVTAQNTSTFTVITANATSSNIYFQAIGN